MSAVTPAAGYLSASFEGDSTKYPGTESSSIYGVVVAGGTADELVLYGTLYGLQSSKQQPTTAANSLGVHVHSGTTCSEASAVRGHYYDASTDPWTNIHYTSDANGVANFYFQITKAELGVDPLSVNGRAFVVHNEDGSRAACAILNVVKAVGMVQPYPGTSGPIMGSLSYTYNATAVTVIGAVSGVEANKVAQAGVANSMGVHIHRGDSCSDASVVGGHYFSPGKTDPWKNVVYTSTSVGTGFFKVTVRARDMGHTSESTAGRAFIIHNEAGGRIGCVLLGTRAAPVPTEAPPTEKPTSKFQHARHH